MAKLSEERILPPFKRAAKEELPQERSDQEAVPDANPFFELAHHQVTPVGFKILFGDGRVAGIQYHDIISPLEYDGAGLITLRTRGAVISIKGKNLSGLFDFLLQNRVSLLREPDSSFMQGPEDQAEIETITLELKD